MSHQTSFATHTHITSTQPHKQKRNKATARNGQQNMSEFARTESLTNFATEEANPRPYSPPTLEQESGGKKGSRTPYFDSMPDDLLLRIFGNLGPFDLTRMLEVDRRFAEVSRSLPLWQKVAEGQPWEPSQGANRTAQTYVNAYKNYVLEQRRAANIAAQQAYDQMMKDREDALGGILINLCYSKMVDWLCAVCYVIFTVLVGYRLDHRIDCAWALVFIPLYLVMAIMVAAPALLCVFSVNTEYSDFSKHLRMDEHLLTGPAVSFLLGRPFRMTLPERVIPFWFFLAHIVTLVVLVSLKLAGADYKWSLTVIPVYSLALLIIGLLVFLEPCIIDDYDAVERLLWLPVVIFVAVGVGFVAAQLDELIHWSWHVVLVPAYLAAIYGLFVHIANFFCSVSGFTDRLSEDKKFLSFPIMASIFVFVLPLVVLVPVVGQVLNGAIDETWITVFTPIWISDGVALIACLVGQIVLD